MISGKLIEIGTEGFSDVHDVTDEVREVVADTGVREGLANVFAIGSTASVTTLEFEPALVEDVKEALETLWPHDQPTRHGETWGDDNGFSHLRSAFVGSGLTVPIHEGQVLLGTWQQIVVIDHDNRPRDRRVFIQVVGE
jgi:secondary thiamine-phosphate synthase enzyme